MFKTYENSVLLLREDDEFCRIFSPGKDVDRNRILEKEALMGMQK